MKNILISIIIVIILICVIPSREISAQNIQSNAGYKKSNGLSQWKVDGYKQEPPNANYNLSVKDLKFKRPVVLKQRKNKKNRQEHGLRQFSHVGLFPKSFNTALRAKIKSNATCGLEEDEEFCRMADLYSPRQQANCELCIASDLEKSHPITNAIDGTSSWWQSPSLLMGKQYEYITIDIDLNQIYEIFLFKIKSAESLVPKAMILERSIDGETYEAWRYFAHDDDDCMERYNLTGQNANYIFKSDEEVICSTEFSDSSRLKYGDVKFTTSHQQQPIDSFTPEINNFTLARFIRIRFQGMVKNYNEIEIDRNVKWEPDEEDLDKRSYYSIQSIIAQGRCFCNGHAGKCREQIMENDKNASKLPQCECMHNTEGKYCERCKKMFNQKPFRIGTTQNVNRCEECQCHGHANECRYSADIDKRGLSMNIKGKMSGGGVCMNCTKFTAGINCEKCLPNYYRPYDRSPDDSEPCLPCDCNLKGSTGTCNPLGGECQCKPGYSGPKCDECAVGFDGNNCERCSCDIRGSILGTECDDECQCKSNVKGEKCNECVPGYFGLNFENTEGCLKCYCSGLNVTCESYQIERKSIETLNGWTVTDMMRSRSAFPTRDNDTGFMVFGMYELPDFEAVYWSAPPIYLGNRLENYGSNFVYHMDWVIVRGDTSGRPTSAPSIILIGKNGLKIAYGDLTFTNSSSGVDIRLIENGWYHVPKGVKDIDSRSRRTEYRGNPVTRTQFMSTLANLESILIRGSYHTDQAEVILKRATLYSGDISTSNDIMEIAEEKSFDFVEKCHCPPGHIGLSCEDCKFGYIKSYDDSLTHEKMIKCLPCDCNGHSDTCNIETNECGQCQHNTKGERCELCADGFYGNAMNQTPNDCQPCACPSLDESKNFSPTCEGNSSNYICTNCNIGHVGDHCEKCDDGFYGNPIEGQQCRQCLCGKNPCDSITGECFECKGNTEGFKCEKCKENFFGDPKIGCELCACSSEGAVDNVCDQSDGRCSCKLNYSGQLCDECAEGYANVSMNCPACNCHEEGSTQKSCNRETGQCSCKSNVHGLKCDECDEMFFGLSSNNGCEGCNCHIGGSIDRICDQKNGQCKCRPHVIGRTCDRCERGYWNIDSKKGCQSCLCNVDGSEDLSCDLYTGQCKCKTGVEGLTCDSCRQGYYGFSSNGCKQCSVCDSSAKVCDQETGRCICPPNTHGQECNYCLPNTWGWEAVKGCKTCGCDAIGSIKQSCDVKTGQCICKEGYTGRACEYCAIGYFGYPNCQKCNCDVRGSQVDEGYDVIDCDERGQCPCKELTTGLKCDECRQATFGLSQSNPSGCTRCFCFGRSQECIQNPLMWGQIRLMRPRNVTVNYIHDYQQQNMQIVLTHIRNNQVYREAGDMKIFNGLEILPGYSGDIHIASQSVFSQPFYFQLPKEFLGDKTSSYGGFLNFSVITDGCTLSFRDQTFLQNFPLIQLHSHYHLTLDYFPTKSINISESSHAHEIVLHESFWRYHTNGYNITRAIMMTALQNIKHIFLRATTCPDFTEAVLVNVTLNYGMPVNGNNNAAIASGVELCECDEKFSGASCQNPADGYFRWRNVTTPTSLLEDLVGSVIPCECNGRSEICNKETGECIDCEDNTGGYHCDVCAEGFYGHPDTSCQSCPCPETNRNFARGCYVTEREVSCYCKEGYTGSRCNRCDKGYFGEPQKLDGSCESCDCNIEGIVSDECDELTGQCNCKHGVIGRRCDRCELPRHLLMNNKCQLCDNCTLTLLDTVEEMIYKFEVNMQDTTLHNLKAPWLKLHKLSNDTKELSEIVNDYYDAVGAVENFEDIGSNELVMKSESIHNRANRIFGSSDREYQRVERMNSEAQNLLMDIRDIDGIVQETIINLRNYGNNENHIKLPTALREAKMYLNDIKNQSQNIPNSEDSLDCANENYETWNSMNNLLNKSKEKLDNFINSHKNLNDRLDDLKNLTHRTFRDASESEVFLTKNNKGLERLREKANFLNSELTALDELFDFNLIASSESLLEMAHDGVSRLSIQNREMNELQKIVDDKIAEDESELFVVKNNIVPEARRHAEEISKRSKVIVDAYENSKSSANNAILAVTAHKNITDAVYVAENAANRAHEAATIADLKLNPEDEETIVEKGNEMSLESEDIQEDAKQQMSKIEELKDMLKRQQSDVAEMSNQIRNSGKLNNDISVMIGKLNNSETMKSVQQSAKLAENVLSNVKQIKKETSEFREDLIKLNERLQTLDPEWDSKFGLAEENVARSLANIREANNTWNIHEPVIEKQNERFAQWNDSFSSKLQDLRDKISLAKHLARGIRISVASSQSDCIRSYFPTFIGPSTSNQIIIDIALPTDTVSSSIFYLEGKDKKFIALEMIEKKINFVWNLGADTGRIIHPMEIEIRDPKYDDAWYRIEATRTMNIGELKVSRMNNEGRFEHSNLINGATSHNFTILTIEQSSRIYLGGPPENIKPKDLSTQHGLSVNVHQLFVDYSQVGLWHFTSSQGQCDGAMLGASETSDSSRHFNGQGYSVVKSSSSRAIPKKIFSLQITFKTLDENALLFLAVDEKNNRSISLTLYHGKLVFRIDYGNDILLEIVTKNRYNTGNWVNVEAARHFSKKGNTENGNLKVENEDPQNGSPTKPVTANLLPEVSKSLYYLGGVPPGFKSENTKAPGADKPFFGCFRDVQINEEIFDPLESQNFYGVESSCKNTITRAGFFGNGYIELPSHSLKKRANFGFVFRTLQPECLLLLSAYPPQTHADYDSKDVRGNFSISLMNGRIVAWIDAGKGRVELESNSTVNDGEYHTLLINKAGRKFEMRINDVIESVDSFSATPALVNSPEEVGGLFLGGIPEFPEFDSITPTVNGLAGSIKDLIFNNSTISLENIINFNNVHMGSGGPTMGVTTSYLQNAEPLSRKFKEAVEGCNTVGSYSYEPNAFKFGNGQFSYSMVKVAPNNNFWHRSFIIKFDFRTFYPDGFLFAAPDSREKVKHYAYLFLRNGNLVLVLRGRKREEISLPTKVNDGLWHHVVIESKSHVATVSIYRNGKNPTKLLDRVNIKIPRKFFVSNHLFIGGLPKTTKLHKEILSKKEDFRGCIRRFNVNGIMQDLTKKYYNLGQCFPKVEKGSYFSGDAYAIYKNEFDVGKHLEIEMEFKSSELNGVLLSISNPFRGSPSISIEVYNGQVIMTCDLNDGGEAFRVVTKSSSKFSLCDNKWHNISALYDTHQIAIRIDDHPFLATNALTRVDENLRTYSQLYLGGLPDSAESSTLKMRENFKGCIRNVKINSEIVDWTDMHQLHNILLNECLLSSSH